MQKKTILITSGAIAAALVLGGVGVAVADPFDDDRDAVISTDAGSSTRTTDDSVQGFDDDGGLDDNDGFDDNDGLDDNGADDNGADDSSGSDDLIGTDLERASAAALLAAGNGTVTDAESSGSSNHAFEVDVRLDDGAEVDVYLDSDFSLVKVGSSDDDSGDDRSGSNRGGDND